MVTMLMSLSLFEINNFTISTSISFVQIIITSKHIRQTIFMLIEVSFFLNNPSKPEIYLFSLEASLVKLKKLPVKYFVFRTRFVLNLNMLKGGGGSQNSVTSGDTCQRTAIDRSDNSMSLCVATLRMFNLPLRNTNFPDIFNGDSY